MGQALFSAIKCIEDLQDAKTADELKATFQTHISRLGFDSFLLHTNVGRKAGHAQQHLHTTPAEWSSRYLANGKVRIDPIAMMAKEKDAPFMLSEAERLPGLTPAQIEILADRKSQRMHEGACFPIHGVSGYEAHVICWGGLNEDAMMHLSRLHLAAIYLFNRLNAVSGLSTPDMEKLSARECEILTWTALGRTAPEISSLLGISRATVHTHIKNAIRKLAARNKIDAVAAALRQGAIKL